MNELRITRAEFLSKHAYWEPDHTTIYRILQEKGFPCYGTYSPHPAVPYSCHRCEKTQDLVFHWED